MKQKKMSLSIVWDMLAPLLLYMVISDLTLYACQALLGEITVEAILPVNAVGAVLAAIPLGILFRRKRRICQEDFRKTEDGTNESEEVQQPGAGTLRQDAAWVMLLAVGACICFNNLLMMLNLPSDGFQRVSQMVSAPPLAAQILCAGLVIPFTEELVFRGLVYTRLREAWSVRSAILISAAYFGVFHGNLVQGIYATILGCLMAGVFEWYDSLAAAWLFHAAANLTSIVITRLGIQHFLLQHPAWMAAAIAGGGSLILSSVYMMKKGKMKS